MEIPTHKACLEKSKLFPLSRAMVMETNPIPVKETMALMGVIEPEYRLPMCRMSDANRQRLVSVLEPFGLIKR